jgi:hypothetical protein
MILIAVLVCAVAVPAALAAQPASPAAFCKNLQKTSPLLFGAGATYKNLGQCVTAQTALSSQSTTNAAKLCKAEQADANFAATHGGKTFAEFYGANPNAKGADKKAYGMCVSSKAATATATQQAAVQNAARKCKAERADPNFAATHGGKTFAQFYGKNANLRNAFGKCVSAYAKAQSTTT